MYSMDTTSAKREKSIFGNALTAKPLLYAVTIFLSAYLLFEVQPIIAKIILPWFGGSASVWITCLLFFQLILLLGYLYAYWMMRHFQPRIQTWIHIALLALSLLLLPVLPNESWKPSGSEDPSLRILCVLAASVGLPYFLLSTTTPLMQAWMARASADAVPYRLFALSNAGSMLALLGYPILIEPLLPTRLQAIAWSLAYAGVAILSAVIALRAGSQVLVHEVYTDPRPAWRVQLLWVALAACASTLLLAVTNHLSQNLAAIPFLWVLPLSLYLLSFIVCFERPGWYRRDLFLGFWAVALGGMAIALSPGFLNAGLALLIPLYTLGLFLCCMVCHGELAGLKPGAAHLTSFYLMVAAGGAIGGIFTGLVAPHLFPGFFELHIGLAACAVLVIITAGRHHFPGAPSLIIMALMAAGVTLLLGETVRKEMAQPRVMVRNFYGELRVIDEGQPVIERMRRKLMHGSIDHGVQLLAAQRRRQPTAYYGPHSGIALALRESEDQPSLRVGVIGLGAGTIAAYGRPGDFYSFYEINPLVIQLANTYFTFLRDAPAKVEIVPGDGRLSLERQQPQGFDVLAVDAFSGDSIPVHLLTREAFALYFRQLKSNGVLAVHVSNTYLDLEPVVQGALESLGKHAVVIDNKGDEPNTVFHATWMLAGVREDFFGHDRIRQAATAAHKNPKVRVWTDDYSNLFRILK